MRLLSALNMIELLHSHWLTMNGRSMNEPSTLSASLKPFMRMALFIYVIRFSLYDTINGYYEKMKKTASSFLVFRTQCCRQF